MTYIPQISIEALADHFNIQPDVLKTKTYTELEKMNVQMAKEKEWKKEKQRMNDPEFHRIVKKFFSPFSYLCQYFSEETIIKACCILDIRDIVHEHAIEADKSTPTSNEHRDYIKTEVRTMPQFDQHGRRLYETAPKKANVYLIKHQYQGNYHGKVILSLLYEKCPALKKFDFSAYSFYDEKNYEVYTNSHLYIPFDAMMRKDIEAIRKRNIDYAAYYNNGLYTPENIAKLLESDETKELFDIIMNM